ncbi:MAG: DUF935 domain-containing protein [Rhodobacteraceae bacterium]|nr:DUF935 domain-containing protein [Paracoccaceae bacterium]
MALLDAYGRPVRIQRLTETGTARPGLTGVRPVWAGSAAAGLTPVRLAGILSACDQGDHVDYVTLSEEMEERDPHYASVLGTRKRAVSGVTPTVKAAGEDTQSQRIADAVREAIAEHDGFADLVEDLLDGLGKGWSAVEIGWGRSAREWWPETFAHVDPRFLRFDRETLRIPHLLTEAEPSEGEPLAPFKFLFHTPRLKSGLPLRGGLARLIAFGWMCKAFALKDWVSFAETYGLPLRLGRYGPEATRDDVEKLFQAVANIGTDAAAVLPRGMEIEFQQAAAGTGGDRLFENLARFLDEQTSKAVLGQTMTSDNGSSMAQAEVHNEVRHDIAAADARQVAGTINRDLVRAYVDLNFGVQPDYPRIVIPIAEPEDTEGRVKAAVALTGAGVTLRASEMRAVGGFSDPEEGDEVVGSTTAPRAAGVPPVDGLANNRAGDPIDPLDEIRDEMLADWQPVLAETLEPLLAAIDEADSYEDARARLDALPGMDSAQLIDALVKGMFQARTLGDVRDG